MLAQTLDVAFHFEFHRARKIGTRGAPLRRSVRSGSFAWLTRSATTLREYHPQKGVSHGLPEPL